MRRLLHAAPLVLAALLTLFGARGAGAQSPAPRSAEPGSELTVYVMTMGPGAQVWERFGHNAIWIRDDATGTDRAYNYGLFDFAQEGFLLRFIQGRMRYWMDDFPSLPYADSYVRHDRSVWVQELALAPAQRAALRDFLEWNDTDEHRFYGYDYYRDNCSTRVRDALDRVLGGRIRALTDTVATGTTYRWHTRRLVAGDLALYTGIDFGLGEPADRPISEWEAAFLPMELQKSLRRVSVPGVDGRPVPLVRSERALYISREFADPAAPPSYLAGFLAAGVVLGVLLAVLGARGRTHRVAAAAFTTVATVWSFVVGAAGLVLVLMWAFTDHAIVYHNENVLQASLLALPLAFLLPRAVRSPSVARAALALAALVLVSSLLGLLLKLLPANFPQQNYELIALILPAHAGLLAGLRLLARATAAKPVSRF